MMSWEQRKSRLAALLQSGGDEHEEGLALDRLLHGQSVIGKTAKTKQVDALRFTDRDLHFMGTLEYGSFGVVDVVSCNCDGRVYVRKSIDKHFALRNSEQCFPQVERDLLLQALNRDSRWAPHLLCAFQSPTHLNLVMDYADGGTLWDVLESSPHGMRIPEADVRWWAPQIVSAVHWCHAQGFVHRDVKPQNFVITAAAHVQLIDFGSAAPLLPPRSDGAQLVPSRFCLVPCGTCDYLAPEILYACEDALVALDLGASDDRRPNTTSTSSIPSRGEDGYGREVDWWSAGVMLYEMVYGISPFFANAIRETYERIMKHKASLRFPQSIHVSEELQGLLRGLLTDRGRRLGRHSITELCEHPFFEGVDWTDLHSHSPPQDLHLPQYTYANANTNDANPHLTTPARDCGEPSMQRQHHPSASSDRSRSQGFAFSALFQSSPLSQSQQGAGGPSQALSILHATPAQRLVKSPSPASRERGVASFIGFSWGPRADAFCCTSSRRAGAANHTGTDGPRAKTPRAGVPMEEGNQPFMTPLRRASQMLPGTGGPGTGRRTERRRVSEREAMKQLLECVGASARKRILESGRKPRVLATGVPGSSSSSVGRARSASLMKELRFDLTPSRAEPPVGMSSLEYEDESGTEGPPSPSPSPRPNSALSRSRSPTLTLTLSGAPLRRMSTGSARTPIVLTPTIPAPARTGAGVGSETLTDTALDGMERRHGELLREIARIEARLGQLGLS